MVHIKAGRVGDLIFWEDGMNGSPIGPGSQVASCDLAADTSVSATSLGSLPECLSRTFILLPNQTVQVST